MSLKKSDKLFEKKEQEEAVPHKLESFYEHLLLNDNLLSANLEKTFHQIPQTRILEEQFSGPFYLRKQTWDVLTDQFSFAPIAQTLMRIHLNQGIELDPEEAEPIEMAIKDLGLEWHLNTRKLLEETDAELSNCLNHPAYGRLSQLNINGHVAADLIEFVAKQPNLDQAIPLLESIVAHPLANHPERDVEEQLSHIKHLLESDPIKLLYTLFADLPAKAKEAIAKQLVDIDHIAFMTSPHVDFQVLNELAYLTGFPLNHLTFPSTVIAKELGALAAREQIPTQIFKAWGENKHHHKVGIEAFKPEAPAVWVEDWIQHGIGSHLAFRVKFEKSIATILKIIQQHHIEIPAFMNGAPMRNDKEGSIVLYCNIEFNEKPFRVEFCYRKEAPSR
jgi:hypothetical protein